jgi:hypothetical protein
MDELVRYIPALRRIRPGDSVLEVGSGSTGICSYVRGTVHAIDPLLANGAHHPRLVPVGTDFFANALPDASYDVVLAIDFLEHVPCEMRPRAIAELIRIARRTLILGFPCGEKARATDERWHAALVRKRQPVPDWLEEHVRYVIPQADDVFAILRECGARFSTSWNAGLTFHSFFAKMAHTPGLRRLKRAVEQAAGRVYPLVDFVANIERDRYRLFVIVEK